MHRHWLVANPYIIIAMRHGERGRSFWEYLRFNALVKKWFWYNIRETITSSFDANDFGRAEFRRLGGEWAKFFFAVVRYPPTMSENMYDSIIDKSPHFDA